MARWVLAACLGAVFWGLNYALSGKLVRTHHVVSILFLYTAAEAIVFGLYASVAGILASDVQSMTRREWITFAVFALCGVLAHLCSYFATQEKNATLAGLLESTYPIFTAIAAYLLFGETQFSKRSVLGALLIFAGILLVKGAK